MPSRGKRLAQIAAFVPPLLTSTVKEKNHCILATAVGVGVCERYGIPAEPLSVEVQAINLAMYRYISRADVDPFDPTHIASRPDDAWGVGISNRAEEDYGVPNRGGWNGHLVVNLPGTGFLDLNASQFHRPQKRLIVPPAIAVTSDPLSDEWQFFDLSHSAYAHRDDYEGLISYRIAPPTPTSKSWETSEAWRERQTIGHSQSLDNLISMVIYAIDRNLDIPQLQEALAEATE